MVFIEWKKEYEMGFREIDKQHRKLVDLINRAYELHSKGSIKKNKQVGERLFADLLELARVHFSTEEKYFEEYDYDGKDEHMQKHLDLMEQLLRFQIMLDSGKCDCSRFLKFIKKWFDIHCKKYDRGYVKCFKNHGLE